MKTDKTSLKNLLNKQLRLGDKWYVIDIQWYNKWLDYMGLNDDQTKIVSHVKPGPLSNRLLLDTNGKLKTEIQLNQDYEIVPEECWKLIKEDYGISNEKDEIERYVTYEGTQANMSSLIVEVKLLQVKCGASLTNDIKTIELSKQTILKELVSKIKELFNISLNKNSKLYFKSVDYSDLNEYTTEELEKKTLFSAGYTNQDIAYLNLQSDDGSWPEIEKTSSNNSTIKISSLQQSPSGSNLNKSPMSTRSTSYNSSRLSTGNEYRTRSGLCGLSNLGNTCFMNSALQCMSNVPMLSDYFRNEQYLKDLNKVNPLGTHGELATSYAELIKEIWSGSNTFTTPRKFKMQLSRFAPQFTGYQQQDSQELLAFLLDGLHEDLNRILKKPYIEINDEDTKPDEVLAKESWDIYKKRNDSVIVDTFHGLIKSTLNCLECNKISVKFDPICYLSLPLPTKKERQIEVTLIPLNTKEPITKYKLTVNKNGNISDLLTNLEKYTGIPRQRYAVCDVYSNKFFHIFESSEQVNAIKERDDIFIYELPSKLNDTDFIKLQFYLRTRSSSSYSSYSGFFGVPLFLQIPKNDFTYKTIYETVLTQLKRFLNVNAETSEELINLLEINDNNSIETSKRRASFKLMLSKAEQSDYSYSHSNQQAICDDEIDDIPRNEINSVEKALVLTGEFTNTFQEKYYNSKLLNEHLIEHESCSTKLVNKKDQLQLNDCFDLYTKKEELSDDDLWYCPKCKKHQHATKQIDLWQLPPVLIIHLKRFSFSRYSRDKIDSLVDFPINNLNLSSFVKCKNNSSSLNEYNLIAVSNHYGGLGGGHCKSYISFFILIF